MTPSRSEHMVRTSICGEDYMCWSWWNRTERVLGHCTSADWPCSRRTAVAGYSSHSPALLCLSQWCFSSNIQPAQSCCRSGIVGIRSRVGRWGCKGRSRAGLLCRLFLPDSTSWMRCWSRSLSLRSFLSWIATIFWRMSWSYGTPGWSWGYWMTDCSGRWRWWIPPSIWVIAGWWILRWWRIGSRGSISLWGWCWRSTCWCRGRGRWRGWHWRTARFTLRRITTISTARRGWSRKCPHWSPSGTSIPS